MVRWTIRAADCWIGSGACGDWAAANAHTVSNAPMNFISCPLCSLPPALAGTTSRGGPPAACRPPDRITLRLPGYDRRADLRANYIAGDHQLHPPILLPALRGVIGSDWHGFAEALRRDRTHRHSLLYQVIAYRSAALLGKPLIVVVPADAVGVTFHIQPQTRMPGDDAGHLGQLLARQRPQRKLGRVEKDIRHVHNQATRCVAGL